MPNEGETKLRGGQGSGGHQLPPPAGARARASPCVPEHQALCSARDMDRLSDPHSHRRGNQGPERLSAFYQKLRRNKAWI